MTDVTTTGERTVSSTATPNLLSTMAIASALVVLNVVLMLALSYTPVADIGLLVFSNFFVGIVVFAITVGGGYWLATTGVEDGNVPLAGAGVLVTQFGYALFGAALLTLASPGLRVPALAITAAITAVITAVVTAVVYSVDHSFARWNLYAGGCFVGGIILGAAGVFITQLLLVLAGVLFLLGFVAHLVHEVWEVKTSAYPGSLINAIGIYVAVMGIFVNILQWVLRLLSILDR